MAQKKQVMESLTSVNTRELATCLIWAIRSGNSAMVTGPPGIGKTSIIRQVAKALEYAVWLIHLVYQQPTDVKGMPIIIGGSQGNIAEALKLMAGHIVGGKSREDLLPQLEKLLSSDGKAWLDWARPKGLPWKELVGNEKIILFLDEFQQAPQIMQGLANQLILDKAMDMDALGPNVSVIAASNRIKDKAATHDMPSQTRDRFTWFEVHPDYQVWKEDYAIPYDQHHKSIGFLNFRQDFFHKFDASAPVNTTPRGWERVSKFLHAGLPTEDYIRVLGGTIGYGVATEFFGWDTLNVEMPDIEAILEGKDKTVPQNPSVLSATCAALVFKQKKLKKFNLENLIKYALHMHSKHKSGAEFSVILMKDLIQKDAEVTRVQPLFDEWADIYQDAI